MSVPRSLNLGDNSLLFPPFPGTGEALEEFNHLLHFSPKLQVQRELRGSDSIKNPRGDELGAGAVEVGTYPFPLSSPKLPLPEVEMVHE